MTVKEFLSQFKIRKVFIDKKRILITFNGEYGVKQFTSIPNCKYHRELVKPYL